MRFVAGAATDVGRVREENEDSFLVDDHLDLFAVADGMGGHRAGEVASATALEALRASVAGGEPMDDAIRKANEAVLEKAAGDDDLTGMGTTLTAVVSRPAREIVVGHVGDSRAYVLRDGELSQLTADHSLVEELVRDGRLTPEQAAVHPQRAIITRALGIEPDINVDLYERALETGDRVLLCSDGLTNMVRSDEIATILRRESHPARAAERLVDAANEAGGDDNVTAVVLDVVDADASEPAVAPAESTDDDEDEEEEEDEEASTAPPPEAPSPRPKRRRRWLRALLVAIPVVVIVAVAFAAVGWYARRTYYVAFRDDRVVLYQGVPGGLLGWDPTLEETTDLEASELTPRQRVAFEDERQFSSRADAEAFLDDVAEDVAAREEAEARPTTTTARTDAGGSS